jgi:hypothetical protein
MLDTPVPIRSLKLSNIGPGYYLDGRPLQGFSGSAGTSPPPADRVQSFQTLFVSIKWLRPVSTKKHSLLLLAMEIRGEDKFSIEIASLSRNAIPMGSFTLATFVSETFGNSDTWQSTTVLALATLGDAAQIGSFLFGSHWPRWPRQVQ